MNVYLRNKPRGSSLVQEAPESRLPSQARGSILVREAP